jgi:branched-chain amino acid transport system ATP-binding protein
LLKLSRVDVYLGQLRILWEIDLEARESEITTLIGPNGAGKTTLFKSIIGIYRVANGDVYFDGKKITNMSTRQILQYGVVYVPEMRRIYPEMTVQDNLELGVTTQLAKQQKKKNLETVYSLFPILKERKDVQAGALSGGEIQMIVLGRGLMSSAKLMLVDEPFVGLSGKSINIVKESLRRLTYEGKTIVISDQNPIRTADIASYIYFIKNGKIALHGKPQDLEIDNKLFEKYV